MDSIPRALAFSANSWPNHVLVLGGGRWARVITEVLCQLLPTTQMLTLCSPRGAPCLTSWARQRGLERRLHIVRDRPPIDSIDPPAVIVANAARDHIASARWALERGLTVLVEKPLALDLTEMQRLVGEYAGQSRLFTAHVFRFARYLESFRRGIAGFGDIQSINIEWTDPKQEIRYGEQKTYDSSVPVVVDCLPHIVSILQTVSGCLPVAGGAIRVEEGGARVHLPLTLAGYPCQVLLARNAPRRRRSVVVLSARGSLSLDFTVEPGVIYDGTEYQEGDIEWSSGPRPLASMLTAFLNAAGGGAPDTRLDIETAIQACRLVDVHRESYRASVVQAAAQSLASALAVEGKVGYALTELLQYDGPLTSEALGIRIDCLRVQLRKVPGGLSAEALARAIQACASNGWLVSPT